MTELLELVELQFAQLTSLKDIVLKEKAALAEQDADTLLALASSKSHCLGELSTNDQRIAAHPDKALLGSVPELSQKIASAKHLLAECQQLNEQNAALIELSLASLNRFSQALQVSRNATSLTYNDKGRTSTISSLGNKLKA
ncbi:flagellar protein FlgN [Shewanella sp. AS16]|uniref:flagella synthesis protein FlgN n=1 Tax=Shewanella sp. AS16 TaxID=2907625 RepID=UPI001F4617A0|nr:flagellar protein FlgN [Shewanella sp. AS16]MCE9686668.1 flagellar protein FlgN [Shewanella sp. AS16]